MPDHRFARALAPTLALVVLALAPRLASAGPRDPLYQWSDDAGAVRYTSEPARIPPARRGDAIRVELPPEPEPPMPSLDRPEPAAPDRSAEADALPPVEADQSASDAIDIPPSSLEIRIHALEREIAADEATLTEHISDPERAAELHASDEVAAIAERLPRLQAELRALREQRAAAATDAP
jgi:hypothetical protein